MFSEDKNMEEIRTADVIIIGGGIMGCATAYRLAKKGIKPSFMVGFRGGAVMGMAVVGACVFGVCLVYLLLADPQAVLCFSFGASSLALFAKVGGGIFTKTADIAADLTGKVELGIPEDAGAVSEHTSSVSEQAEKKPAESVDSAKKPDPEQEDLQAQGQDMTPQELLDILAVAERVKCTTRHCDTSSGRRESVAEHSWRTALLAMLLSGVSEYKDYDMDRVIRMCLIHDLGEAFTGDIPTFEKTAADEDKEVSALMDWVGGFPEAQRREFSALFSEMEKLETREARLYKAIDKIEAVIQHNESDIRTWLPLEYDLQLTYGQKEAAFSPWLSALRGQVDQWTREKIESAQNSL